VRILVLADGRAVHTVRYKEELIRNGVEVILASLERGETVDVRLGKKSISNSLNYVFANRQVKELVRKYEPHIVNPHFASAYGFTVALSKVWKKKPVVLHCLGSDILISAEKSPAHRRKVAYALSKAAHVFVDSQYLADKAGKLYPLKAYDVIPWGVEKEILDLYEKRKPADFKMKRPLKILVPRPHNDVYNNFFIIASLKDFINDKTISLTFPNWGDKSEDFRRAVKLQCRGGTVEYYDFMKRADYIDFIAQFDVYLTASLSDSSPASLIEAMGSGMFPVVADIPGVRGWVSDRNALLFSPEDGETLRKAMQQLLDFPPGTQEILASNHKKVRTEGFFEDIIKRTISILENLLVGDR
jgi:glycosyltransferase involved in cell wall biosynthesis